MSVGSAVGNRHRALIWARLRVLPARAVSGDDPPGRSLLMRAVGSRKPFAEAEVSGSVGELVRLAALVRGGAGRLSVETGDPAPHQYALGAIVVETTTAAAASVSLSEVDDALEIAGPLAALTVLAANLKALAEAEDGHHIHFEWHPGHEFLAEDSVSLVATLADSR